MYKVYKRLWDKRRFYIRFTVFHHLVGYVCLTDLGHGNLGGGRRRRRLGHRPRRRRHHAPHDRAGPRRRGRGRGRRRRGRGRGRVACCCWPAVLLLPVASGCRPSVRGGDIHILGSCNVEIRWDSIQCNTFWSVRCLKQYFGTRKVSSITRKSAFDIWRGEV